MFNSAKPMAGTVSARLVVMQVAMLINQLVMGTHHPGAR